MAAANNPRKFSEKIALHNQKQAEETAAFEEVMMELTNSRLQAQKVHQLRLSQTRGQYYGGSLPNVNAISSNAIADFQGPFNLGLDSNRGTRHHGLVERVQIARLTSPHRRQVDSSPYSSAYLALPPDSSWRRNALPWCNFPAEKGNRFGLTSALSRTNSDSALHTSVSHPSAAVAAPYPNVGPTPLGQNKKSAFSTSALPLDEFQDEDKTLAKAPWDTHKVQSSLSRPKSCEMPGLNKGGLLFPEAGTLFGQEGVEETMAWSPPAQLRDDTWRRGNKMSIFSSPDGSGGGPHVSGGLNTGGSLPDLTNLHFPSPLPTPLDPEEAAYGIAGGNSTGNLTGGRGRLGLGRSPRDNTDYRPAGLSSSLQGSLSNMSLQSSLSNPSLHSSLGASSLQPSLSNPSLGPKAGPVGASPRRRAAPINPLVLSAADSRRGHAKQFSPTMSPTLSSIAQGIPLDTSSLSDQRLPPYPFCQQQAFQQTGYPQSQPTQQTAFPQSQSTQFPPSSHSSHQTGYSQSQSPQQTTFPPSQSQQTAFPQSQSQQTGYSQSQSSQQAAFQQSQSQQAGYSQPQSQQTAFPQSQSSHPTQLSPSQSAQQTTFPQSQSNQQIVYPPSQSHQAAFPQSQSSQQTAFPQSQQNHQMPFPQSQSAQQTAFPKSQSSHQTQFPQSQQNQQTAFPQSQSSQQTAFPQSHSAQQTAFPQSQQNQQTAFPQSQSSQQTAFPQSQSAQQTAFPKSQSSHQTQFPQSQQNQQTAFPQSQQNQQTAFPQSQQNQQTAFPQSQSSQQTAFPQSQQNQQTAFPQSQSSQQTGHHQTGYQQPQLDYQQELFQQNYPQQQQPSSQTTLSYKVPAGERLQEGPCPPGAPLLNKHNLFYCSRVGPIPNIILTGDSPPGLSKEIATALAGMPGFEMEPHYPLDEGLVEPLTLASLSMLSDPDLNLLSDPDLEDGFRADRL